MRTCAYYEHITHVFMISHEGQSYLMRFIMYASIYKNTIYTDYCVHKIINRIVYNHSRLHMNLFHSLYYILSTPALMNTTLIFNSCVHAYIMNILYRPS